MENKIIYKNDEYYFFLKEEFIFLIFIIKGELLNS